MELRHSLIVEKNTNVSYSVHDILRLLQDTDSQASENLKFEVQDNNNILHCMKTICSCIGVQKVIIAQSSTKERKLSTRSPVSEKQKIKCETSEDDDDGLELSGCPLEKPFESSSPIVSSEEDSVKAIAIIPTGSSQAPVRAQDARKLFSFYNKILAKNKHLLPESVPLLVLCDCTDGQRTALLGSCLQEKMISLFDVSVTGPLSPKALPPLSSTEEKHLRRFKGNKSVMTETDVFCKYHLLDNDPQTDSSTASSLHLECRWKKVTSLLETPDANAICQLLLKVVSGEERSPAYAIYKELLFLKRLLQGLQTGEVIWSSEASDTSVIEKVKTLLSGVKDGCQWRKSDTGNQKDVGLAENFDSILEAVVIGKRQNIEFTDHLWTALIECTSYAELKESLQLIMSAVIARTVHPVVLRKNNTTLGNWIRRIIQEASSSAEISLEGSAPLKLLLELGIEKLKKDYCFVFVGLELATQESLQPFLVNNPILEERVNELDKLHGILELIVMCKTYLHLSKEVLSGFARQAVKFYSSVNEVEPSHQFQFLVQLSAVRKTICLLLPVDWEVCFKTATENYTVYTCCQLSIEPPFSYVKDSYVGAEKDDAVPYFCTTVTCVQDSSLFA